MDLNPQNGLIVVSNFEYGFGQNGKGYQRQKGSIPLGEIDLMIIDPVDRIIHVFEEKANGGAKMAYKARKQLKRARGWLDELLFNEYQIKTYRIVKDRVFLDPPFQ